MKQAIIYGGAFNPPTLAHHAILQACFDFAQKNHAEVWIMPCGDRSDKSIGVSIKDRLRLVEALVEDVDEHNVKHRVVDIELRDKQKTDTYRTHLMLKSKFPAYSYCWVFGSDSVNTMKDWNNGVWLFNNLKMLVVSRPNSELLDIPQNASLLDFEGHDISSTEVRRLLKINESIKHLVTPTTHALLVEPNKS